MSVLHWLFPSVGDVAAGITWLLVIVGLLWAITHGEDT